MLWGGRCKQGLVTAALLTLDPATISMLTAANMLAPDGRCKTLDASADGFAFPLTCALDSNAEIGHKRPCKASPARVRKALFLLTAADAAVKDFRQGGRCKNIVASCLPGKESPCPLPGM